MRGIYTLLLLSTIFFSASSQNISVNTTGAANSTSSMFEVIQPATAANSSIGIFARHLGTAANAYAIWAEATGATNRYAIVVPAGGGNVGIGTTTPSTTLQLQGGIPRLSFIDTDQPLSLTNPSWIVRGQDNGWFRIQSTADFTTITDRITIEPNGNTGIGTGTVTPTARLDVTGVAALPTFAFGQGTTVAPSTTSSWGSLIGKGTTSNFAIALQDGGGRTSLLWNASGTGGTFLASSEPATRMTMSINGTTGGVFGFYGAGIPTNPVLTAGTAIVWRQMGYMSSDDQIWFSPRGTSSDFYIPASSGFVGIGTTSPAAQLEVASAGQLWIRQGAGGALAAAAGAGLKLEANVNGGTIQAYNYTTSTANNLNLNQSGGNVGVGTATPAYKLDVAGPARATGVLTEYITGTSAAPTITAGPGANGGTFSITGTNLGGRITFNVPAGGTLADGTSTLFTVTYAGGLTYPNSSYVVLYQADLDAANMAGFQAMNIFVVGNTTSFVATCGTASLTPSATYVWNYIVVGN